MSMVVIVDRLEQRGLLHTLAEVLQCCNGQWSEDEERGGARRRSEERGAATGDTGHSLVTEVAAHRCT